MTRFFVPRTWTEIDLSENGRRGNGEAAHSGPLKSYRDQDFPALVLLGAPGAGKTTCLRQEEAEGRGHYVTARDFITFEGFGRSQKPGSPLLIDGLDEIRAGTHDGRVPLDAIRSKLEKLNFPIFRLSCREAAWLGTNDWYALRCGGAYPELRVVRLDPLSPKDIREILPTAGISDPENFVEQAKNTGFGPLLENPQRLKMLARAAAGGGWPASRTEIFGQACRALLVEANPEYQVAERGSSHTVDSLLNRAGEMCALQLLSGRVGWALDPACLNEDFPALTELPLADIKSYQHVLATKLFDTANNMNSTGRFTIHRQIAEYLGARFLRERLKEGLPLRRVLALMIGNDGMVVASLQGLAAWLAVLYQEARREIIDCNPLGMIFDVDLSTFSREDRTMLFRRLQKEAEKSSWFWNVRPINFRLGDLLTEDMVEEVSQVFETAAGNDVGQGFALLLVESLRVGKPSPVMLDFLASGLHKETWHPLVKRDVLRTLVHHWKGTSQGIEKLRDLLHDFNCNEALDHDDQFTGLLLRELYPDVISFPEVLAYLRPRRDETLHNNYYMFWTYNFSDPDEVSSDQRRKILDILAGRAVAGRQDEARAPHVFEQEVFLFFLRRHLEESGDDVEGEGLFTWLDAIKWGHGSIRRVGNFELVEIKRWLHSRTPLRKELLELGLRRHGKIKNLNQLKKEMNRIKNFLFDGHMPTDFGTWCLKRAQDEGNSLIAQYFAQLVAISICHEVGNQGLSPESVVKKLEATPDALAAYRKICLQFAENQECEEDLVHRHKQEQMERRIKRRTELKQYDGELRGNRASPGLLEYLATAYFGDYVNIAGNTPHERLKELADNDEDLVQAILSGLRGCVDRDDLPSPKEVIRHTVQKRRHQLVWPFMAGMEETANKIDSESLFPTMEQARLALTIHYARIVSHFLKTEGLPYPPSWYDAVVHKYPDCAKESLVKVARSLLRTGRPMQEVFSLLVNRPGHDEIAHAVLPRLLKSFPVRCSRVQLGDLEILLLAALKLCKRDFLLGLVKNKLALVSMNTAQRIYWLGMGLRLEPGLYLKDVGNYVGRKESRIAYLLNIVDPQGERLNSDDVQDIGVLSLLIRLGGSVYHPWSMISGPNSNWVETPVFRSSTVSKWINYLAKVSSEQATKEFKVLKNDIHLRPWLPIIQEAAYRQKLLSAEERFHHASLPEVFATLNGNKPANPTDFRALLVDQIECLAREIRGYGTSDWNQYWEERGPRIENFCRDAFLSDLRRNLSPLNIIAEPEISHSNSARSDIEFRYKQAITIPAEVKKSDSRDLWSAIRNQLIPRYTRKPGSGGQGIYLVFWFGNRYCQPNSDGKRAHGADELRQMLEVTLLEEERSKVSVCVIDVSWPSEGGKSSPSKTETVSA